MKHVFFIAGVMAMTVLVSSCNKDKNDNTTPPAVITKTKDITVNFSSSDPFTLFSFKDTTVIANSDSMSAKWDFALRLTTFLVNSHSGGPGNAGVIVQDGIFDNISLAPQTGYAYDTTASQRAIKDGTWYDYDINTHNFVPKAGKVFLFHTADGVHYAKMEILAANYVPFTGPVPQQIIYTVRFSYQPGDTNTF
jgi:hypothetical protein